jgi:iron complex outermembrane receptor protein
VGGFVDYQAGLYFIKVNISATYQKAWGNDAGAWFASNSQYATLDATPAGQLLMENSLANARWPTTRRPASRRSRTRAAPCSRRPTGTSPSDLTLTTGARLTHENRTNVSSSYVINPGDGVDLSWAASRRPRPAR